jgi:hypothetical protein
MNRSQSKIRHIQASNLILEKRTMVDEQSTSPKQTPKECDPATVKEIPTGKEKEYQHMTGVKAWREIDSTTKYFYCRVK